MPEYEVDVPTPDALPRTDAYGGSPASRARFAAEVKVLTGRTDELTPFSPKALQTLH
jgi:hypothetical protein